MKLKRYTFASLLLMIGLGWFIFAMITSESYALKLLGVELPMLPIALLVILPMIILYLASLMHMMYFSLKTYFNLKQYEKDYNKLSTLIANSFLNKEVNIKFSTVRYRNISQLIVNSNISPKNGYFRAKDEKINKSLEILEKIEKGEWLDLKRYALPASNFLVEKNILNGLEQNHRLIEDVLLNKDLYNETIVQKAIKQLALLLDDEKIKKFKNIINYDALLILVERIRKSELDISVDILETYIKQNKLTTREYINLAKVMKNLYTPEEQLKLFENLYENNEDGLEGYLYVLLDLEMINDAKALLEDLDSNECLRIRAYLDLKESKHQYTLDFFL
jgi:hypothetical protein